MIIKRIQNEGLLECRYVKRYEMLLVMLLLMRLHLRKAFHHKVSAA